MGVKKMVVRLAVAAAVLGICGCGGDNGANTTGGGGNNNCTSGATCKQVTIGTQVWMAENLNIATADSWCYGNNQSNCAKYGRLYTWYAAKTACPTGWHLPSREEWGTLAKYAGGTGTYGNEGGTAGTKLKSKTGWHHSFAVPAGTDDYGFSALPGGFRSYSGSFGNVGTMGWWWTATERSSGYAYDLCMLHTYVELELEYSNREDGLAVRCVGD